MYVPCQGVVSIYININHLKPLPRLVLSLISAAIINTNTKAFCQQSDPRLHSGRQGGVSHHIFIFIFDEMSLVKFVRFDSHLLVGRFLRF